MTKLILSINTIVCGLGIAIGSFLDLTLKKQPENYIVGGHESAKGRWPWQVSLQGEMHAGAWYHTCGAILVAPQYILTAAQCVDDEYSRFPLRGWFGAFNLTAGDAEDEVPVSSVIMHPKYRKGAEGTPYDIALLRLDRPVKTTSNIAVATLAEPLEEFLEADCYITGWGYKSYGQVSATYVLQEAEISVIPSFNCSVSTGNVDDGFVNCGQICVLQEQLGIAACLGDFGGPLSCRKSAGSAYVVAGVASWVVKGCLPQYPSVYTRVSYYRNWIDYYLHTERALTNEKANVATGLSDYSSTSGSKASAQAVGFYIGGQLLKGDKKVGSVMTREQKTKKIVAETSKQEGSLEAVFASHSVPFIVNGRTSTRGRWPWQVSLQLELDGDWYHICGASLIASNWILTAAHCVKDVTLTYRGWFGAFDLSAWDWADSVPVAEIKKHPKYKNKVGPWDIAVLRMERDVRISSPLIQIATLPNYPDEFIGAECYITGWGYTDGITKELPSKLQEARIPVISNDLCAQYVKHVLDGFIDCGNICLLDILEGASACNGDSGGPLSCRHDPDSPWVVAGLTSWGVRDCPEGWPSVYTRTSYYRRWVEQVTGHTLSTHPTPTGTSLKPSSISASSPASSPTSTQASSPGSSTSQSPSQGVIDAAQSPHSASSVYLMFSIVLCTTVA